MTETHVAINNFAKTLKEHTASKIGSAEDMLKMLAKIKTLNPPVFEEQTIKSFLSQRAAAIESLIDGYVVAQLSKKLPLIDPAIFKLKRYLTITDEKLVADTVDASDGNPTEAPLFLHCDLGKEKMELAKHKKRSRSVWGGRTTKTVAVTVSVPKIPAAVKQQGYEAMSLCYRIVADLYENEVTSDLVDVKPPLLEVMWIPAAKSINVKVDVKKIPAPKMLDPALVLVYGGHHYLVSLWDIEGELPYDNFLREFTIGKAAFPKKQ